LPVLSDDLPQILEPRERDLAALILQRIRSGNSFDFHYFSGSEPGKLRKVLPVLLFTTALDGMPSGVGTPNPIYLLAWCQLRNAPRTFSLNRMERKQDQSKTTTSTDILD
jgi:predicted DNA-binding transcriptional regulator YafY